MAFLSRLLFWTGFVGGAYKVYQGFPQALQNGLLTAGNDPTGRKLLRALPSSAKTAQNYIAGTTLDEAIAAAKQLNESGRPVSLSYLGDATYNHESIANRLRITQSFVEMSNKNVVGDVTVVPSMLGLRDSAELAQGNLGQLLEKANGRMIWLAAEDHTTTSSTIALYNWARDAGYTNVGVTMQCALYRAWGDINRLTERGDVDVRLTAGMANEPSEHAFPRAEDGRANLMRCIDFALTNRHLNLSVVSTNGDVLQATMDGMRRHGVTKDAVEFVLPFNVETGLQAHLVNEGYKMRVQLPYGEAWESVLMERLADSPADAILLLGNL